MPLHRVSLLLLGLALGASTLSTIRIPGEADILVQTPVYSKVIGPALTARPDAVVLTAPVSAFPREHICDAPADSMQGQVWLTDATATIITTDTSSQIHDEVACAQERGAVAVLRQARRGKVPGYEYYFVNSRHPNIVQIPVLVTVGDTLDRPMRLANAGVNVTIDLTIDDSEWVEMWQSAVFALTWRGALTVLNFGIAVLAMEGLVTRIRLREDYGSTNRILQFGCGIEFVACTLRGTYHAIGPFISTTQLLLWEHFFFISFPAALEMVTNLLAVLLFMRWGAFRTTKNKKRRQRLLAVLGAIVLLTPVAITIFVARHGFSRFSLNSTIYLLFIITAATCIVFLRQGRVLIRKLNSRLESEEGSARGTVTQVRTLRKLFSGSFHTSNTAANNNNSNDQYATEHSYNTGGAKGLQTERRRRVLTRAVRWVMVSAVFQSTQLVALLAMGLGAMLYPWQAYGWMTVNVTMQSLGSLAQVQAFLPRSRDRKSVVMRVIFARTSSNTEPNPPPPSSQSQSRGHLKDVEMGGGGAVTGQSLATLAENGLEGVVVDRTVSVEMA